MVSALSFDTAVLHLHLALLHFSCLGVDWLVQEASQVTCQGMQAVRHAPFMPTCLPFIWVLVLGSFVRFWLLLVRLLE
jgi:hypothetical protein